MSTIQTTDSMKKPKRDWPKPRRSIEIQFMRQLRKVARASGHIVGVHIDGTKIIDERSMKKALADYAKLIEPWARRQSLTMITKTAQASKKAMHQNAKAIGQGLRLVAESDVGKAAVALMDEQVELIKSIPIRAGERAQELALMATIEGTRASEIAQELSRSGEVSESDAMRIARTEVARANTAMVHARATAVGSIGYLWRNSGDSAVRHSHKVYKGKSLEGQFFRWNEPPTLDDGTTGHPGTFPNCRCYPEPVFPT